MRRTDINLHRASDTVTVTVRAAPAVTAVALTSVPRADADLPAGRDDRGERDLLGAGDGDRDAGDDADDRARGGDGGAPGAYARNAGPAVLVFGYTVTERGHGRRRHRGAGGRHPARRRDHRRRERRGGGARPRCGGGGLGAPGSTAARSALTGGVCERTRAGARRAGGGGAGERRGGDELLEVDANDARRDHRRAGGWTAWASRR